MPSGHISCPTSKWTSHWLCGPPGTFNWWDNWKATAVFKLYLTFPYHNTKMSKKLFHAATHNIFFPGHFCYLCVDFILFATEARLDFSVFLNFSPCLEVRSKEIKHRMWKMFYLGVAWVLFLIRCNSLVISSKSLVVGSFCFGSFLLCSTILICLCGILCCCIRIFKE